MAVRVSVGSEDPADRWSPDRWEAVVEEHSAVAETIREYVVTLDAAPQLLKSKMDETERLNSLLAHCLKMRQLGHQADVNIAKLGEHTTFALHFAKQKPPQRFSRPR